jgi:hypothetical protein
VLGLPTLRRCELAEALGEPSRVGAEVLAGVAVPFEGLSHLCGSKAGGVEAIAHGTAEFFVGVAAEAELGVAVHPKKLRR